MRRLAAVVLVVLVGCMSPDPYVPPLLVTGTIHESIRPETTLLLVPVGFQASFSAYNIYPEGMVGTGDVDMSWGPESVLGNDATFGIRGVAPGAATVTAAHLYNGTYDELAVQVDALGSIATRPNGVVPLAVGAKRELLAYGWYGPREHDVRGSTIDSPVWTSADDAIAVLEPREYPNSLQVVRGVAPGQATITLMFGGMTTSLDVLVE